MASRDFSDQLMVAVMRALRADTAVKVIVGTRVRDYVDAEEKWPFLRIDPIDSTPFEASGWVGSECAVTVHAFVRGEESTKAIQTLDALIVAALDEVELPLSAGNLLSLDHRRTTVIPDIKGPGSWHGIVRFEATIVAATAA
jgi:hypothetical protein